MAIAVRVTRPSRDAEAPRISFTAVLSPLLRRLVAVVLGLLALVLAGSSSRAPSIPPLVFVSRHPIAGRPELVPGLGPEARAATPGGKLLVRESNGRVRELVAGRFLDVSDPTVSWDGRRVVFAGVESAGARWRLWSVGADGGALQPVTSGAGDFDDLDPCWMPDGQLVFASTRFAMRAEEGGFPVTNLWIVNADGTGLERLTTERNGAEEPSIDPKTGRIVYARWWTNRWLATESDPRGITLDRAAAVPGDTVDLWQAIAIEPDARHLKLAGGDPRTRATTMAYQPVMLADGSLVGVSEDPLSLVAPRGRPFLQYFHGGFAEAQRFGGGDTATCAPAVLPDGRLVVSLDPRGRGDYGLWVMRADGRGLVPLLDLPGTLELDAAVLAPRPRPPVIDVHRSQPADTTAVADEARLHDHVHTFRFDCLNVFANAPLDQPFPNAIPMQRGVRIRFYATLDRPAEAGGDTAVLVRESDVTPWGGVHEDDMPADVPMFEQLVDENGKVLRSAMGPAHVAGLNFAPFGSGTQCVGCHVGHSAIVVPTTYSDARWIDASPSAEIEASSTAPDCRGPRAVADRRTRGRPEDVGWIARGNVGEFLRLRWRWPIEVREIVLYPLLPSPAQGTDLRILEAELVLSRAGRVVERSVLHGPLSPRGTHATCNGVTADAAEIRFTKSSGGVAHRPVTGLLEVVTIARLAQD